MFILRQIAKDSVQHNMYLGDHYHFVPSETDDFDSNWRGSVLEIDKCIGVIVYNEGREFYPLYTGFEYYIMTGEGKTFTRIAM